MYVLTRSSWFKLYKSRLYEYRNNGMPAPEYPSDKVETVEALVDNLIRESIDTSHVR